MKRTVLIIIVVLIFLTGLGVLSYPLISSVVNNMAVREGADTYRQEVEQIPDQEIEEQAQEIRELFLDMQQTKHQSICHQLFHMLIGLLESLQRFERMEHFLTLDQMENLR